MLFSVGNASAGVTKLSVSGTFTYQLADTGTAPVIQYNVQKVSFNNKRILAQLDASGTFVEQFGHIPAGAYLGLTNYPNGSFMSAGQGIVIFTKAGGVFADLTWNGYASGIGEGFSVVKAKINTDTMSGSGTTLGVGSFWITDEAGNSINIGGVMKTSLSLSKAKASTGLQTWKESGSITGSGVGLYQGDTAVCQGKGSGSLKGTE